MSMAGLCLQTSRLVKQITGGFKPTHISLLKNRFGSSAHPFETLPKRTSVCWVLSKPKERPNSWPSQYKSSDDAKLTWLAATPCGRSWLSLLDYRQLPNLGHYHTAWSFASLPGAWALPSIRQATGDQSPTIADGHWKRCLVAQLSKACRNLGC